MIDIVFFTQPSVAFLYVQTRNFLHRVRKRIFREKYLPRKNIKSLLNTRFVYFSLNA